MNSEKAENFKHLSPKETVGLGKEGDYFHRLELRSEGEIVGYADFDYSGDPFPLYYISLIIVKPYHQGRGFGSAIVEKINEFLNSKGRAGILINANAVDESSHARNMYEHHGWKLVPGRTAWFVYNLPKGLGASRLEQAIYKVSQNLEQKSEKYLSH